MIRRGFEYLSRIFTFGSAGGANKGTDLFNWDNCNPCTNGEYFLIEKNAVNWDVCLDVGANAGEYAAKILEYNPMCRVVCFEPNEALNAKMIKNGIKEIYNSAVGDICGLINININLNDPTQSSIYRKENDSQCKLVNSITIDDFLQVQNIDRISFLKIDTEGHELAVLKGAKKTLCNRKIEIIQFEYGGTYIDAGTTLEEIYKVLIDNYIVCHLFPQGVLPVKYSKNVETYRYSNWVALSRDLFCDFN